MSNSRKKSSGNKNKDNSKIIFVLSFILTFMLATGIIGICLNYFSPTVDVNIGQNDILPPEEHEEISELDDRLKWIQDEDNFAQQPTSEKYLQKEKELNTTIVNNKNEIKKENVRPKKNVDNTVKNPKKTEEIPYPENLQPPIPPVPSVTEFQNTINQSSYDTKTNKVYTGFYKSQEEAQAAKSRISQNFPDIQPFVKEVNGQYIVQAGSFTSRKKAVKLKEILNSQGYTAKLLSN